MVLVFINIYEHHDSAGASEVHTGTYNMYYLLVYNNLYSTLDIRI